MKLVVCIHYFNVILSDHIEYKSFVNLRGGLLSILITVIIKIAGQVQWNKKGLLFFSLPAKPVIFPSINKCNNKNERYKNNQVMYIVP